MDDDEFEAFLSDYLERCNAATNAHFETLLAETPDHNRVPMPGDCHPYYTPHRGFVVDWLDGATNIGGYQLQLPKPVRPQLFVDANEPIAAIVDNTNMLARRRVWAPAPYVGRAYVYVWECAVDNYGRSVAGTLAARAWIEPEMEES